MIKKISALLIIFALIVAFFPGCNRIGMDEVVMYVGDFEITFETFRHHFMTVMAELDYSEPNWREQSGYIERVREETVARIVEDYTFRILAGRFGLQVLTGHRNRVLAQVNELELLLYVTEGRRSAFDEFLAERFLTRELLIQMLLLEHFYVPSVLDRITNPDNDFIDFSEAAIAAWIAENAEIIDTFGEDYVRVKQIIFDVHPGSMTAVQAHALATRLRGFLNETTSDEELHSLFVDFMREYDPHSEHDEESLRRGFYFSIGSLPDQQIEDTILDLDYFEISDVIEVGNGFMLFLRLPTERSDIARIAYEAILSAEYITFVASELRITHTALFNRITPRNIR